MGHLVVIFVEVDWCRFDDDSKLPLSRGWVFSELSVIMERVQVAVHPVISFVLPKCAINLQHFFVNFNCSVFILKFVFLRLILS